MCGGIAAALNLGSNRAGVGATFGYHGGRVISYTLIGVLFGLATSLIDLATATLFLRYLAGFMLIAMGLYVADWWRGLVVLEKMGAKLWQPVQKLSGRILPIRHWYHAIFLGLVWGLMPCGLIYSSLALAATYQDAAKAGMFMLVFGLGTMPAMLATSFSAAGAQKLLRSKGLKLGIALLLIGSGFWTLYLVHSHGEHILNKAGQPQGQKQHQQDHHHHHH